MVPECGLLFYEDPERKIAFYLGSDEGAKGYQIKIGGHYFCLLDRFLDRLVRPEMRTPEVMGSLWVILEI